MKGMDPSTDPVVMHLEDTQIAIDVVIFTIEENRLKVLLIRRRNDPYAKLLALPGGFLRRDETTRDAAKRILQEKAGVEHVFMEQLYTFDAPKRDPRGRVMTVTYFALVPRQRLNLGTSPEVQAPQLGDALTAGGLAFDHDEILAYALRRLRAKLQYTNAAYSLLPERFTFSDLQKTYEIIFGRNMDKRNFRKKYMSLGLIEATNEMQSGGRHRPAQLFKFIDARPQELPEPAF